MNWFRKKHILAAALALFAATSCAPVPRAIIPPASVVRELNVSPVENASRATRDAVIAALAALPDGPEKVVVQTAFEKDAKFVRSSPTIAAIAGALGLTSEQVDDLFRLGAGLSV